ncbi:MAG: SLC13/DASS family transporter [Bdellovibrionales bacterium]|nr:SLC13/DASS family transporter [Bdellovibrionales bacterium]
MKKNFNKLLIFLSFIGVLILFYTKPSPAISMLAVMAIMALWWIFEVVPLSITSLLPLILYPLLGIMSTKSIAPVYASSLIFLFIGSFFVAIAMQRWNLHRRIAIFIMSRMGGSPYQLLFGCMLSTAALSMWLSNTATTLMIFPIVLSLVASFEQLDSKNSLVNNESNSLFYKLLLLSIAYSANIGGMGTLIGTPPNIVFSRIYSISFPNAPEVSFAYWMFVALPIVIALLLFVWGFFCFLMKKSNLSLNISDKIFEEEKKSLGIMKPEEKKVMAVFLLMIVSWIFRKNFVVGSFVIPGWSSFLSQGSLIDDGTVAIFCAVLLFILPSKKGSLLNKDAVMKIPWGIILLFGGGFALATGMKESGLLHSLTSYLSVFQSFQDWQIVAGLVTFMSFLTEVTSNTSSTEIILPVLSSLSKATGISPLLLMMSGTLAASTAFMLPSATMPNAIILSSGKISIKEMMKIGFFINLFSIVIISVVTLFFI